MPLFPMPPIVLDPGPEAVTVARSVPLLAIYGDSYSGWGFGADTGSGWPARVAAALGLDLSNQAVPSTGYVTFAHGQTFPYQAVTAPPAAATAAVVFGSLNDQWQDPEAVRIAAAVTFAAIRAANPAARLLVVGPPWPATQVPPAGMPAVRDAVAASAAGAGAVFVDAYGWLAGRPDLIGADGWHPHSGGHAVLAALLLPHIAALTGKANG